MRTVTPSGMSSSSSALAALSRPPSTPAPVWAPRWTLTYSTPSWSAASTSVCMLAMDFARRSSFGVQRLTRYDEWMTHGPSSFSSVSFTKRSVSSSLRSGSCQTCGDVVNICPQLPPNVTCRQTAFAMLPCGGFVSSLVTFELEMETCAPTCIHTAFRSGVKCTSKRRRDEFIPMPTFPRTEPLNRSAGSNPYARFRCPVGWGRRTRVQRTARDSGWGSGEPRAVGAPVGRTGAPFVLPERLHARLHRGVVFVPRLRLVRERRRGAGRRGEQIPSLDTPPVHRLSRHPVSAVHRQRPRRRRAITA